MDKKLDLSKFLVFPSDNPKYVYELYDLQTGVFLCYYLRKKKTRTTNNPLSQFPI